MKKVIQHQQKDSETGKMVGHAQEESAATKESITPPPSFLIIASLFMGWLSLVIWSAEHVVKLGRVVLSAMMGSIFGVLAAAVVILLYGASLDVAMVSSVSPDQIAALVAVLLSGMGALIGGFYGMYLNRVARATTSTPAPETLELT